MTTKEYAKQLAASIDVNHATKSEALAADLKLAGAESDNTTHFSVIDKDGLAVANTYTLEHSYGLARGRPRRRLPAQTTR